MFECARCSPSTHGSALGSLPLRICHPAAAAHRRHCTSLRHAPCAARRPPSHLPSPRAQGNGVQTLVRCGGLDSIVVAMQVHMAHGDLVQRGATALGQIAETDGPCRQAVVEARGVQVCVDGLRVHAEKAVILERLLAALAAVAGGGRDAAAAVGGYPVASAVADVMCRHPSRTQLQSFGLAVLGHLAGGARCLDRTP